MRRILALVLLALLVPEGSAASAPLELSEQVVVRVPAVAQTRDGLVGTAASVTITVAREGAGHVFLDTFPHAQVDMQASARTAARVAGQITGANWRAHDYFLVVRSGAPLVGGPSGGVALTVGVAAALQGWTVRDDVLATGMVAPDGSVGAVGGLPEKARAARDLGATRFLYPAGQDVVRLGSGEALDLPEWCARELALACVPVAHVVDAVREMTDHRIVRPDAPDRVTDETYRALVAPLSEDLLAHADALVAEATEALALTPDPAWAAALDLARERLFAAQDAVGRGEHYTGASLAFQSSIEARSARDGARLQANATTVPALLEAARRAVDEADAQLLRAQVHDAARFEAHAAAQVRLLEARERLRTAEAADAAGDQAAAVREAAYAAERAATAAWWTRLGSRAPAWTSLAADDVPDVARETLSMAREAVGYVEAVLGPHVAPEALAPLRSRLAQAESAFAEGLHPAAALAALETEVRATVFLDLATSGVSAQKQERAREEAARAIAAARTRGVEPLLAQSQYEFGASLEDPVESLVFLGLARLTAHVAASPGVLGGDAPVETRFQALPPARGAPPSWLPAVFAAGLALGAGMGVAAVLPRQAPRQEREEKRP